MNEEGRDERAGDLRVGRYPSFRVGRAPASMTLPAAHSVHARFSLLQSKKYIALMGCGDPGLCGVPLLPVFGGDCS